MQSVAESPVKVLKEEDRRAIRGLILELARCRKPLEECGACQRIVRALDERGFTPQILRQLG